MRTARRWLVAALLAADVVLFAWASSTVVIFGKVPTITLETLAPDRSETACGAGHLRHLSWLLSRLDTEIEMLELASRSSTQEPPRLADAHWDRSAVASIFETCARW